MGRYRPLSKEEIEAIPDEELFVCESCDHHCHTDNVGSACPQCGKPVTDPQSDEAF